MARRSPQQAPANKDTWIEEVGSKFAEARLPNFWTLLEQNCSQWALEIAAAPFWTTAKQELPSWRNDYRRQTGSDLLSAVELPTFRGKGAKRTQEKVRGLAQSPPATDHFAAAAPVPLLNDLVRTRVACKYIDGVEFLTSKLEDLATKLACEPSRVRQGRVEGYFAQHLVVSAPVHFRAAGAARSVTIRYEIQIATELSTRLWESAHGIYEVARVEDDVPDEWQWAPNDPRFIARQLGHMIHLADGLLVQLRKAVKK